MVAESSTQGSNWSTDQSSRRKDTNAPEEAVEMEKQVAVVPLQAAEEEEGVRSTEKENMIYRKAAAEGQ